MLGSIIRLVLLCAVIFGVVYGITRALRANAHSRAAEKIRDDIRALRADIARRTVSAREYEIRARELREACQRQGIDVPDLPDRLDGPDREEG